MMPSKRDSLSTLTSFYTIAEQKRKHSASKNKKKYLAAAQQQAEQSSICRRQKNGYFVNRSVDTTSYLCFTSKLTQSIFNKYTIGFIILAIYLQGFKYILYFFTDTAYKESLVKCQLSTLQSTTTTIIKTEPDLKSIYNSIINQVQSNVDTITTEALKQANFTIENQKSMAVAYTWALASGYNSMSQAAFDVAYDAAQNATTSLKEYTQDKIKEAKNTTQVRIDQLSTSLDDLKNDLNSNLFNGTELNDKAKISLSKFDFSIPTDVSSNLSSYKSRADWGFNRINNQTVFSISQIRLPISFNNNFNASKSIPQLPQHQEQSNTTSPSPSTNCPIENTLFDEFNTIKIEIRKVIQGCIITCGVFASIAIVFDGLYEYYAWKRVISQAKSLETLGGFQDAVQNMDRANNPLKNYIGEWTAHYFCSSTQPYTLSYEAGKKSKLTVWVVNYAYSDKILNLVTVCIIVALGYIFQTVAMSPLSTRETTQLIYHPIHLPSTNNNTTQLSLENWTSKVNNIIKDVESSANDQLERYYNRGNTLIKAAMVDSAASMRQRMNVQITAFKLPEINTPEIPIASFKNITIPRVNTTNINPKRSITSQQLDLSRIITQNLKPSTSSSQLTTTLQYFTLLQLQVGLGFLISWMITLIFTVTYAIIKKSH